MSQLLSSKKLCLPFLSFFVFFILSTSFVKVFSADESCQSGIKILSDFDDTIKTYPSKRMSVMGYNALFKKHINVGFDILYRGMTGQKADSFCGGGSRLTVISASPIFLYNMVHRLLNYHQFPKYRIILRPLGKESRLFKTEVFERILEEEEGPFVLIGDDVNEDPVIYHELKKKFPKKIKEVYIHNVENKNFFSGQRSYWTAFDLALMEHNRGRISTKTLLRIGKEVLKSSPWKVLPPYGNCPPSGFLKNTFIQNEAILKMAKKIDFRIQEICRVR